MENVKLVLTTQYLLAAEMAHEDSLLQGAFPLSSIYKHTGYGRGTVQTNHQHFDNLCTIFPKMRFAMSSSTSKLFTVHADLRINACNDISQCIIH